MTYLASQDRGHRPQTSHDVLQTIGQILRHRAKAWRDARDRRRTGLILASLDPALLDDIGAEPPRSGLDWAFVRGVGVPYSALRAWRLR